MLGEDVAYWLRALNQFLCHVLSGEFAPSVKKFQMRLILISCSITLEELDLVGDL